MMFVSFISSAMAVIYGSGTVHPSGAPEFSPSH